MHITAAPLTHLQHVQDFKRQKLASVVQMQSGRLYSAWNTDQSSSVYLPRPVGLRGEKWGGQETAVVTVQALSGLVVILVIIMALPVCVRMSLIIAIMN